MEVHREKLRNQARTVEEVITGQATVSSLVQEVEAEDLLRAVALVVLIIILRQEEVRRTLMAVVILS